VGGYAPHKIFWRVLGVVIQDGFRDFRGRFRLVGRQNGRTSLAPTASVCRFKPPEADCEARICNQQPALVGFKRVAGGFSLWRHKRHARHRLNLVHRAIRESLIAFYAV